MITNVTYLLIYFHDSSVTKGSTVVPYEIVTHRNKSFVLAASVFHQYIQLSEVRQQDTDIHGCP